MRRRDFIKVIAGSTVAWSSTSHAQQARKIPTIGVLWHAGSAEEEGPYFKALLHGFSDLGYADGRTIKFEHRFPNKTPDRFKSMAAELVSLNVDVLVSIGGGASIYAKDASSTVPVVFVLVTDPIGSKLINSFSRPEGNVTGLSNFFSDITERRLQLFTEIFPGLSRVAQLVNPTSPVARLNVESIRAAAEKLRLTIQIFEARTMDELKPAFDAMKVADMQGVTAGSGEGLPYQGREAIAKLALSNRLALCAFSRETFEPGALMSYAPDQLAILRRAATYVDKILKGTRPSEIPVETPTKFEFLINLKTAKVLSIDVPSIMLSRADEVIE
jgi:putative tryptophan/tyrosine transport system substrate-binding protein